MQSWVGLVLAVLGWAQVALALSYELGPGLLHKFLTKLQACLEYFLFASITVGPPYVLTQDIFLAY
jgi:hypothetical protein